MKKDSRGATVIVVFTMIALVCFLLVGSSAWAADSKKKKKGSKKNEFTTDFRIEDCTFSDSGRNAYFSLNQGDSLTLTDGEVVLEVTVLTETRDINFVTAKDVELDVRTRVVEELETENGAVIERSRNFFARCEETNDIFYFGEEVEPAALGGAWLAGEDDALPGLIMPGTFLLGSRYFQEQAPEVALDRSEHVAMGLTVDDPKDPSSPFEDCVEVVETTPLERGKSIKRYCPGIGLVFDDGVELMDYSITAN